MELKLEEEILSTNSWGILRIINKTLIDNLIKASEEITEENVENARKILANLITIFRLNDDEEIVANLREIYLFVNKLITEGFIKRDETKFKDAIKIVTPIYEAFREKEVSDDVKIVSGLTYGEKELGKYGNHSNFNIQG